MRPAVNGGSDTLSTPVLIDKARILAEYAAQLSQSEIIQTMKVSGALASKTKELMAEWTDQSSRQRAAIDSFLGDIYSGLQIAGWSDADKKYADVHLRILSGLYGILKPLDGIYPYRLEMGYKLPKKEYANLYTFWGESIVDTLPKNEVIIDLSAVEYGKTITKFVDASDVVSPRFLTISPKTGEPIFVVVHAKIARGAFASWIIRNKIEDISELKEFNEIGYEYSKSLSTNAVPVFVCQKFEGLGLSVRLS